MTNPVQDTLTTNGYAVAGGIWGSAAWKKHKGKVYAVGQGADFLNAPKTFNARTKLWIYQGPFHHDYWIHDGEPPLDCNGEQAPFVTFNFANLFDALIAAHKLQEAAVRDENDYSPTITTFVDIREITL